jgi:glutathione S-transferase
MGQLVSSSDFRKFHSHAADVIVHVIPASQYSTKVLAGLTHRGIPHYLVFADGDPPSRRLPSGGDMVPELEMNGVGTPDSSAIFRFLDGCRLPQLDHAPFFPSAEAVGDEAAAKIVRLERLAEIELDHFCNYFNFIDPDGYQRSVRQSLARYIPPWAFWVNIDDRLAEKRSREAAACRQYFLPSADSSVTLDSAVVRRAWHAMLLRLEAEFTTSASWTLCGTDYPTAADFGVFSKFARLQDHLGDVSIGAGYPEAMDACEKEAPKLLAWYQRMRSECPLVWRNKRVPFVASS